MYEEVIEKVFSNEHVKQIPIVFITQVLVALDELGMLKGDEDDD